MFTLLIYLLTTCWSNSRFFGSWTSLFCCTLYGIQARKLIYNFKDVRWQRKYDMILNINYFSSRKNIDSNSSSENFRDVNQWKLIWTPRTLLIRNYYKLKLGEYSFTINYCTNINMHHYYFSFLFKNTCKNIYFLIATRNYIIS